MLGFLKTGWYQRSLTRTMYANAAQIFPGFDEESLQSLARQISELDSRLARKTSRFIAKHSATHEHIIRDVLQIIWGEGTEAKLSLTIEHFDYVVQLGWNYPPTAFTLIVNALRGDWLTTTETKKQRALIAVEDSRWEKSYTVDGGHARKRYSYHRCVLDAAIQNPDEVQRVIDVAQQWNPQSSQQLDALLEGNIPPILSEGVL